MFNAGRRTILLFLAVLLAWGYLGGRLYWVQVRQGPQWAERARLQRYRRIPVAAPRGDILDRQGRLLVGAHTVFALYAVPAEARRQPGLAERLAALLGKPVAELQKRIQRKAAVVWLARQLPEAEADRLRAHLVTGIGLAPEDERTYPEGDVAAQVLGFTGVDNQGLDGLELIYDRYLKGRSGWLNVAYDARNRRIPGGESVFVPPRPGDTITLTLDERIQRLAERTLRQAISDTGGRRGTLIAMDPRTGAILALAGWPTYNPAKYQEATGAERRDMAVVDDLPPGSTFKPVTAAAGLASGAISPSTGFYDPGFVRVQGATLHCWKKGGHGSEDLAQVVENSCNVGFVDIGLRLGVPRFYQYLKAFGLLGRTGVDLPGEAKPIIPPVKRVKQVDLATMAFGQTLAITPISLIRAISVIANGGKLVRPHLLWQVRDPEGRVIYEDQGRPLGRAIPERAANEMARLMSGVVSRGTGKKAQVPGFVMAGKTGTAQVVVNGRYEEGKYIASFIGFGPRPHPDLAVLIDIEEPVGEYFGGQIAAPVFSRFVQSVFNYQRRQGTATHLVPVPKVTGQSLGEAQEILAKAKLGLRTVGAGDSVAEQLPPAGTAVAPNSKVLIFLVAGVHRPEAPG